MSPAPARAQDDAQAGKPGKEELGDTAAPPPSSEDLGAVKPEEPAPPPPPKKKKPAPAAASDAGPAPDAKPEPKPAPAPKPSAKPAPAPPAPPPAAEAPSVAPDVATKAQKLKDEGNALLAAVPGDARALDAFAAQTLPDGVAGAEPALKPMMKLARARALMLQSRFDEAVTALTEVRGALDPLPTREQRRMTAEIRYHLAEIEEAKSKPPASCGPVGLVRVAALEGRVARARMETLDSKYRTAVKAGDRFWSRRAAFRTAALSEDFYRAAVAAPEGFRGAALPSPFAVDGADVKNLVGDVLGGAWPAEISRLYSELIASIDVREPDPVLLELVRSRAAAFARIDIPAGERAQNPWRDEEKPGLVRFNKRFEKREVQGWVAVDPAQAKAKMAEALAKGPGSVEHAFALAGLAEAGPAPSTDQILAALHHASERVQLAGLVAAEKAPSPALVDALVEIAARAPKDPKEQPFATLQGALYGTRERALLALRALANKDRDVAEKLLQDQRLPARERTWIIAELAEGRLQYTLQTLAHDRDPIVAATAIYALALATGKNASGWLRPNEAGVVGCVSRAIASFE
jgi:hypothetical protein